MQRNWNVPGHCLFASATLRLRQLLALCAMFASGLVHASGPYIDVPEFFAVPFDEDAVVAGREFSTRTALARTMLYLHVSGAYSPAHAALFEAYLDRDTTSTVVDGQDLWRQRLFSAGASNTYFETRKWITRNIEVNGRQLTQQQFIDNCLNDAFVTASATYDDRRARYGADSPAFARWFEAQQQVFANCSGTEASIPSPPQDSWSDLERYDRAYQVAASYFYSLDYREAAERFRQIAADAASPWAEVSRYLVARSLVRDALTLDNAPEQNLQAALDLYRGMAAEPDYLNRFPSVIGQIRMIEIRRDRSGFLDRVGVQLLERPAEVDLDTLDDFLFVLGNQDDAGSSDLVRFNRLARVRSGQNRDEILALWHSTANPAWLFVALDREYPATALAELVAAVDALDPATPGYADMQTLAAERLAAQGNPDQARSRAERVLARTDLALPETHRNRLRYVMARTSRDPVEFVRLAPLRPVAMRLNSGGDIEMDAPALRQATRGAELLTDETVALLNDYFTPAMLLEAVRNVSLNDYLRGRLLIAAWVRALLLDDAETATASARLLATVFPELREQFEQFVNGPDRDFAAARLIVDHPGFSPWIPTGIGRYRREGLSTPVMFPSASVALPLRNQNWWCTAPAPGPNFGLGVDARLQVLRSLPFMASLPEAQLIGMAGQRERLQQSATEFAGPALIDYARRNPGDARVPEALHRLVFATRYACESGPGEISQAAFSLLHRNYPDSEWAEQTPYWFD